MKLNKLFLAPLALFASSAMAVPVLQLGPTAGDSGAYYGDCGGPETWCLGTDAFNIYLAPGNQDISPDDEVYIVFSAVPPTDSFTIDPMDQDSGDLASVVGGFGTPPETDPNDLPPHGIFDANYEIYRLYSSAWDPTTVPDTQPGMTGTADGYVQTISMYVSGPLPSGGIHIDAFTCGTGTVEGGDCLIDQGWQFAPFSHDATLIPVPAAVWLFGSGLLGLVGVARRRKNV